VQQRNTLKGRYHVAQCWYCHFFPKGIPLTRVSNLAFLSLSDLQLRSLKTFLVPSIVVQKLVFFRILPCPSARPYYDSLRRKCLRITFFFPVAQQPKSSLGHLLLEFSQSHSDTPHSVGLLWMSDQSVAETSTLTTHKHSQETNVHAPGEIGIHDPSKNSAERPRLRPRSRWDRRLKITA
jgi:hypothetical protein